MKLPALGNVKVVTLVVLPLAFIFAVTWAAHQDSPVAWVGQNLMVSKGGLTSVCSFCSRYFASAGVFVASD